MDSKISATNCSILCDSLTRKPSFRHRTIAFSSYSSNQQEPISVAAIRNNILLKSDNYNVSFKTLGAGKLSIARYPDFEYDAEGGVGTGIGTKIAGDSDNQISVCFDPSILYIPPLTSKTTKFLGFPLPPFLKIEIVPKLFQGKIDMESGKVDLEFVAEFCFSVGILYKAPPLVVKTVLTSEESQGKMKTGGGERLDKQGKCRLVGVATVDPIDDFLMNTFLGLPTECLADLNAVISCSSS